MARKNNQNTQQEQVNSKPHNQAKEKNPLNKKAAKSRSKKNQVSQKKDKSSNSRKSWNSTKNRIFVGGITSKINQKVIFKIFSKFGKISKVKFAKNNDGGSKGYCFVDFYNKKSVENTLKIGNIWLDFRLLSIRKAQLGHQLGSKVQEKSNNRLTIYGLPQKITDAQKQEMQNYFSKKGLLEYYYITNISLTRLSNPVISQHYDDSSIKEKKVNVLNLSYKDPRITSDLITQKVITINNLKLFSTFFCKNKPSKKDYKAVQDYQKYYQSLNNKSKKIWEQKIQTQSSNFTNQLMNSTYMPSRSAIDPLPINHNQSRLENYNQRSNRLKKHKNNSQKPSTRAPTFIKQGNTLKEVMKASTNLVHYKHNIIFSLDTVSNMHCATVRNISILKQKLTM